MVNIEKSALDKLGIHELRDLAREIGVHLPTTFKRDDLCNEIMEIVAGTKEPYKRKYNQGRPPKNGRKFSDVAEVLLPNDVDKEYVQSFVNSPDFIFNANQLAYAGEEVDFSGNLICNEAYGIIRSSENQKIYVTITLINKYGLLSGDKIEGCYRLISDDRKVVSTIYKINDVESDKYTYTPKPVLDKNKEVKVGNNVISIGGASLINKEKFDIKELAKSLGDKYDIEVVNINVKESDTSYDGNVKISNVNFNLQDKDIYELSVVDIYSLRRRAEVGSVNTIVVINSLTELIKVHNTCLTQNVTLNEIMSKVLKDAKQLLCSAFLTSDSSFTIVDVENEHLQFSLSEILNYDLINYFDKVNK